MKARRPINTTRRRFPAGKGAETPRERRRFQAFSQWFAGKAPILWFGGKFCALAILFHLLMLIPFCERLISGISVVNARLSSAILNLIGEHNHLSEATLWSGEKSVITVLPLCSGVEFLSLFSAAVLVFPVPFARKLPGVVIGVGLLLALNLVRIMSLFLIGTHCPVVFDFFHEQLWGVILVIASITLYIAWMRWAGRASLHSPDVTA